jgi:hypothetical protein
MEGTMFTLVANLAAALTVIDAAMVKMTLERDGAQRVSMSQAATGWRVYADVSAANAKRYQSLFFVGGFFRGAVVEISLIPLERGALAGGVLTVRGTGQESFSVVEQILGRLGINVVRESRSMVDAIDYGMAMHVLKGTAEALTHLKIAAERNHFVPSLNPHVLITPRPIADAGGPVDRIELDRVPSNPGGLSELAEELKGMAEIREVNAQERTEVPQGEGAYYRATLHVRLAEGCSLTAVAERVLAHFRELGWTEATVHYYQRLQAGQAA